MNKSLKILLYWLLVMFIAIPCYANASQTNIFRVHATVDNPKVRIVFSLSQPVKYHLFTMEHPSRVILDIQNARFTTNEIEKADLHRTVVKNIRHAMKNKTDARVVIDVQGATNARSFLWPAHPKHQPYLVVEITPTTMTTTKPLKVVSPNVVKTVAVKPLVAPVVPKPIIEPKKLPVAAVVPQHKVVTVAATKPDPEQAVDESTTNLQPAAMKKIETNITQSKVVAIEHAKPRDVVVVIDPGHGGKDSGATGALGTEEKNIVLSISLTLAGLINQQPGMHAVLTRSGDYFVPLRGRLDLARRGKGDLFIAIHADSYFNPQSSGVSIYALSRHGATSEASRWLANQENYSELGGGSLEDKSYLLRSILLDMEQTATIRDSLRLGTTILSSVDRVSKLHYDYVEQAPFMVLKSPDIPSILIETGFLSNRQEELRLRDKAYQAKLAQAIMLGVKHYVSNHPVVGA